jgi:signal transduction histidine kinase
MSSLAAPPPPRLRGWDLVWRYGICIAMYVVTLVVSVTVRGDSPELHLPWWLVVVDGVLGLVALGIIRFRHRHPVAIAVALVVMSAAGSTVTTVTAWALIHLAMRRRWREIVPVAALGLLMGVVAVFLQIGVFKTVDPVGIPRWLVYAQALMWVVLGMAVEVSIGVYLGARRALIQSLRDRAEHAERNQELRVLQGQAAERNRIAREMHDVLAHRISLVSMHAGVLAYRTDLSPDQTREIATLIQENAHQSLTELRAVLGWLRQDTVGPDAAGSGTPSNDTIEKPQPTLADIPDLVEDARAAGERIDVVSEVEHPELLPTLVGRHAYRVVQEALTNARKHAPHARVTLSLSGRPGEGLLIRCVNPLVLTDSGVPGAGVGLVGLAERAQVTGGRISHGETDDRQFELEVWLPW